jgi:hypothetical protein
MARATAEEAAKQRIARMKVDEWSLARAEELRTDAMKAFNDNEPDAQAALSQVARFIAPRQQRSDDEDDGAEKAAPKPRRSRAATTTTEA